MLNDLITLLISWVWFELEDWSQLMWMNWRLILFHWLGLSWKTHIKLRSNQIITHVLDAPWHTRVDVGGESLAH